MAEDHGAPEAGHLHKLEQRSYREIIAQKKERPDVACWVRSFTSKLEAKLG